MTTQFHGPLRPHPDNGRYFTDAGAREWKKLTGIDVSGDKIRVIPRDFQIDPVSVADKMLRFEASLASSDGQ